MKGNVRVVADRSFTIASWPKVAGRTIRGARARPSGGYESDLWADRWERPRTLKWCLTPTTEPAYLTTRSCNSAHRVREWRDDATRNFLAPVGMYLRGLWNGLCMCLESVKSVSNATIKESRLRRACRLRCMYIKNWNSRINVIKVLFDAITPISNVQNF